MTPKWQKLPAIEGSVACLTCGSGAKQTDLKPERPLAVSFGSVEVRKDGNCLWSEGDPWPIGLDYKEWRNGDEEIPEVADIEKLAAADPDHDWRIWFFTPMWEGTYQRHGENEWILVSKGEGFA